MVDDRLRQSGLAESLLSLPEAIQEGLPFPRLENRDDREVVIMQVAGHHEQRVEIAARGPPGFRRSAQ